MRAPKLSYFSTNEHWMKLESREKLLSSTSRFLSDFIVRLARQQPREWKLRLRDVTRAAILDWVKQTNN